MLVFLRIPLPSRTPPSRRRAASSLAYTPSSWVYRPYICVHKRQKKITFIQVLQVGGNKRNVWVLEQVFHLRNVCSVESQSASVNKIKPKLRVNRQDFKNVLPGTHTFIYSTAFLKSMKKKNIHSTLTQQSCNDFFADNKLHLSAPCWLALQGCHTVDS